LFVKKCFSSLFIFFSSIFVLFAFRYFAFLGEDVRGLKKKVITRRLFFFFFFFPPLASTSHLLFRVLCVSFVLFACSLLFALSDLSFVFDFFFPPISFLFFYIPFLFIY